MRVISTLIIGVVLSFNAAAETQKSNIDVAEAFFHASEAGQVSSALINEILSRANQRLNQSQMDEQQRDVAAKNIMDVVKNKVGKGVYQENVKKIYAKFLSEDDMKEIVKFYETDTGKKFKNVQRIMNKEVYDETLRWMEEMALEISKIY